MFEDMNIYMINFSHYESDKEQVEHFKKLIKETKQSTEEYMHVVDGKPITNAKAVEMFEKGLKAYEDFMIKEKERIIRKTQELVGYVANYKW